MMLHSQLSPLAEVTGLWMHDWHADRHWNLLTVIEEVPAGQPLSPELASIDKNRVKHPVKRKALKGRRITLYAARAHLKNRHIQSRRPTSVSVGIKSRSRP